MKNKKILSIFLVVIVITTLFVSMFSINSYAVDEQIQSITEINSGDIFLMSEVLTLFPGLNASGDEIIVDCDFIVFSEDYDFVSIVFRAFKLLQSDELSMYIYFIDSNGEILPAYNYGFLQTGWVGLLRVLKFTSNVQDVVFIEWMSENSIPMTDVDGYYYRLGYEEGFFQGYSDGERDGIVIGENSGFGQNIIGDTLSAPVEALDNLVLYETSSGLDITLWHIVSTLIGVSLFIWFMKMFAGG